MQISLLAWGTPVTKHRLICSSLLLLVRPCCWAWKKPGLHLDRPRARPHCSATWGKPWLLLPHLSMFLKIHSVAIHPLQIHLAVTALFHNGFLDFFNGCRKWDKTSHLGAEVCTQASLPLCEQPPNEDPLWFPFWTLKLLSAQQTCFHRWGIKYFLLSLQHHVAGILLYLASIFFKTVFQGRWVNACVLNLTQWTKWTPGIASHLSTIIVMYSKIQLKMKNLKIRSIHN